jgi:hypothetical protein
MAEMCATDETTALVREALASGARKDLQTAAKAVGVKANSKTAVMTRELADWLEATAAKVLVEAPAAPAAEPPAADETAAAPAAEPTAEPAAPVPFYPELAATPAAMRTPAPLLFATPEACDTQASFLSLGISGLKADKPETTFADDLASYLDDLNVDASASPRAPLGAANAKPPVPGRGVATWKGPGRGPVADICTSGPAAEYKGTHVRF